MQTCGPPFRSRCWTLVLLNYSKLCEIATKYLAYLLPLQCHSCILVGTCCKQKVPHFHLTSTMFDPGLDRLTTVALRYSHPNPNEARTKSGAWNLPLAKPMNLPGLWSFLLGSWEVGSHKKDDSHIPFCPLQVHGPQPEMTSILQDRATCMESGRLFHGRYYPFTRKNGGKTHSSSFIPFLPLTSSDMFYACSSPLWWETKVEKVCKSRRPAPKTRNLRKVGESGAKGPKLWNWKDVGGYNLMIVEWL